MTHYTSALPHLLTPVMRNETLRLFVSIHGDQKPKNSGLAGLRNGKQRQSSAGMRDICAQENMSQKKRVWHCHCGTPMKGAAMFVTLQKIGVVLSLSRPAARHVHRLAQRGTTRNNVTALANSLRGHSVTRTWTACCCANAPIMKRPKAIRPERRSGDRRSWEPVRIVRLDPKKVPMRP